jgi:hypothetical protein
MNEHDHIIVEIHFTRLFALQISGAVGCPYQDTYSTIPSGRSRIKELDKVDARNQKNKKILNVTQSFQETTRSLTNFFRPRILPAARLASSRSIEVSGNSPVTRDVEKEEEEMEIKKGGGVKRLGWRVSRRGSVSVGRVDELISCSLCSRMFLPFESSSLLSRLEEQIPTSFSLEECPLCAEVVEGKEH